MNKENALVQASKLLITSYSLVSAFDSTWLEAASKTILSSPVGWHGVLFLGSNSFKSTKSFLFSGACKDDLDTAGNETLIFTGMKASRFSTLKIVCSTEKFLLLPALFSTLSWTHLSFPNPDYPRR